MYNTYKTYVYLVFFNIPGIKKHYLMLIFNKGVFVYGKRADPRRRMGIADAI